MKRQSRFCTREVRVRQESRVRHWSKDLLKKVEKEYKSMKAKKYTRGGETREKGKNKKLEKRFVKD